MSDKYHPGARFNFLTLIEEAPRRGKHRYWLCRCDCEKECVVCQDHLQNGHTKSCGCYREKTRGHSAMDITEKHFGRLVAKEPTNRRAKNSVIWRCVCECKKVVYCSVEDLNSGQVQSCGCLQEEQRKKNMEKAIHFVDGTCVEKIACQRESAANTSGHRGVWRRENGKWRAELRFQGRRYYLGTYENFADAVNARLEAEQHYYGEFLKAYYENEITVGTST